MSDSDAGAPAVWRGRYFEDFGVGDIFRSRLGRTITETDNTWFTAVTMNTNQVHFNAAFAEGTRFGRLLVNSCFTLALVTGLSVPDTSENGTANLAWDEIKLPNPVFVGDTLFAESEIVGLRESGSNPSVGIVSLRTRGLKQDGTVVIEFRRTFMCYRKAAAEAAELFPAPQSDWTV